jgi:nucleotide-binding universal stress UspA family protein
VEGRALQYLKSLSERIAPDSVSVQAVVRPGPPAETIIDYVNRHPTDLIVMSSHGRSGLRRWVVGSVADEVLRAADVPVRLVCAHSRHRTDETR